MILIGRGLDLRSQRDCWKSQSCAVLKVRKKAEKSESTEDGEQKKCRGRRGSESEPTASPASETLKAGQGADKQIELAAGKKEAG